MPDMLSNLNSSRHTILKFASVGVLATATHAIVYILALELLALNPQMANLTGYTLALAISYFGQRTWTFSNVVVKSEVKAGLKFFVSSLFSLALNAAWVSITVNLLQVDPKLSIIGIIFITPIVVFIMLKLWVFAPD